MSYDADNFPPLPRGWCVTSVYSSCDTVNVPDRVPAHAYKSSGRLAVVDQGVELVGGYTDDVSLAVDTPLPVVVFGDHTRVLKFIDFAFAAGADGIKVLRPLDCWVPRLFYHFLRAVRLPDRGYARHYQFLRNAKLPVPPLAEQKRILDPLDTLLGRVDSCRERLDRVPGILTRFRRSVLVAATTGELTRDWRDQRGIEQVRRPVAFDDDLVDVPASWDDAPLTELLDAARPLCYGVVQPGESLQNGRPLVRVQDLRDGTVAREELRTISNAVDLEYQRSRVHGGDVLISVVGTIGRLAIVPDGFEGNIARAIARLACGPLVLPEWMKYWLENHVVQWWLLRSSREVARKTLNLSELATTRVAVPPRNEQLEIIRRAGLLLAQAAQLERRVTAARHLLDSTTPSTLAKAFRGELLPQDPADEPAAALLERLRPVVARKRYSSSK